MISYFRLGSVFGFLAVVLGAFGAHALKDALTPTDAEIYRTATQYLMFHALVLLTVGQLQKKRNTVWLRRAGFCFALGSVVFCGTLFALVLTQMRWLGAITPLGGVMLLLGWASLVFSRE